MDAVLVLLERILTPWERAGNRRDRGVGRTSSEAPAAAERFARTKTGGGNA